jgi:anaerobic magnesium-protoporphyrin IX monomethyl ester cyclase
MGIQNQVDLVLVNPANRSQIYQSLASDLSAIEPPVWAGLMATFIRNKGYSVQIVDSCAEELTPEATAQRVADLHPRLVAVVVYGQQPSASTQVMPGASQVCTAIRQNAPGQKIILVGGHVTALPERTLNEEDVDYVAGGEALYTLLDLVEAFKQSPTPNLARVRDLYYRKDGHVEFNMVPAPLLKDLDNEMPGIAWDLLPMDKYRAHNWHTFGHLQRQPYASLYTTLGCPYHCSFCCIQAPFKSGEKAVGIRESVNSYRFWSPQKVLEQIDLLVTRYGVRNIKFADEMFVLNPRHVLGICDLIDQRGYDLNIWAYSRVDTVKDGMLERLRRAGFHWLAFGIEAASERVRQDVQKGFSQEDVYRTIRQVQSAGMNIIGNYIFGLPEDDMQTMQATLDLALDLNCEFGNFYSAMAYPGSALYNLALQENWELPASWSGYSQHAVDTKPLRTKYLTATQVLQFRDYAFQAYFTSPTYLQMVERRFGAATVEHIKGMTALKLVRQIV